MVSIKRINKLKVAVVPEGTDCSELTAENADVFYTASQYSQQLYEMVVSEFEETLKKEAGLEKKIKETKKVELKKGDITVKVTATPGTSTSYQSVCNRLETYLTDLKEAADNGVRRAGIRTLDESTYVALTELQDKVDGLIKEYTNPRVTPRFDYTKMRDDSLEKMLQIVEVEPENCGKFTEANAKLCRIAKEQLKRIRKNVVDPFKKALKEETGYNAGNIPEETIVEVFEVGKYRFKVISAPREEISYGEVIKQVQAMLEIAQKQADAGKAEVPGLKIRDGQGFIEINYLNQRYEKLMKDNRKTILEQEVKTMPIPEYDKVIAG